ncbi:hypothetical protein TNCV_3873691 [Trichonephila clavipes]|nr:hypothetical protein TNCV_3873691 [Trichonephila clavipes]
MGKLSGLDAFVRGEILGTRRSGHSTFENVRQLGVSKINSVKRIPRIHEWWTKNKQLGKLQRTISLDSAWRVTAQTYCT